MFSTFATPRVGTSLATPHDGDDEGDVGLDGLDDLGERHAVSADEGEQPVARLGERREAFERLERGGQPAAVALAWSDAARGRRCGSRRGVAAGGGLVC